MFIKTLIKKILSKDFLVLVKIKIEKLKFRTTAHDLKKHYENVISNIKTKYKNDEIIHFGAYVVFDSVFAVENLIEKISLNKKLDFKIVIVPDTSRGVEHQKKQYEETKKFFEKKYGSNYILDGYLLDENKYIDLSKQFDFIYVANPYDSMTNKYFTVSYLSQQNCLPIYMSYGSMPDKYSQQCLIPLPEISKYWRVYADTKDNVHDFKKYELISGKNVVLSGYSKMDDLAQVKITARQRKRIIIAPHHTINNPALPLSNFLKYSDFILQLPDLFPQVDFVFRPHPLLFINLINQNIWTKKEVEEYIEKLQEKNIEYSKGGDYLELFANSDGMIHDCSSFLIEYLFTGKPCCYALKNKKMKRAVFSKLGRKCLGHYYVAYSSDDINNFIKNVVIKNNDPIKNKRHIFAKNNLMVNYPNVSDFVLNNLLQSIMDKTN